MDQLNLGFAQKHREELGLPPGSWSFPERIIQFGTGVLLRALVDFLVDKGNQAGFFGGSIVVVKSTGDDTSVFSAQDNLYTVLEKGPGEEGTSDNPRIITAISRVLAANQDWQEVLECARDPRMDILVSNTTEAGLVYQEENILGSAAPVSFPGKLTRYLWERYQALGDDYPMVILPTELLVDNGPLLKSQVLSHARTNKLPQGFIAWLESSNRFCSTLVDRIVPGKSQPGDLVQMGKLTYLDHLHTAAEPYLLWAVEGDDAVRGKLGFYQADPGMIIREDIFPFREQKLRILNGSNTLVCGLGYLYGCNTTFDTMEDPLMARYVETQINAEILPTIADVCPDAQTFAIQVLERFHNPAIGYPLLNITLQYTSKMDSRNGLTFIRYHQMTGEFPPLCSLGLAAYLLFYVAAEKKEGIFSGRRGSEKYSYRDEYAPLVCDLLWQVDFSDRVQVEQRVALILSHPRLFKTDLTRMKGFAGYIASLLLRLRLEGASSTLKAVLNSLRTSG